MSETTFSKKILTSFNFMHVTLNKLCLHIYDELCLPLWIDNGSGALVEDRDRIIYALKHMVYDPHLTAQETFGCPGAIASTIETISLIQAVNKAKDAFKSVIHGIRQEFGSTSSKLIRDVLAQDGHGVVKLKEVYRHLHYIPFHPRRIGWTKARNGANVVISYQEALQRLLKGGEGHHVNVQLAKLSLLNKSDKLVIHRDIRPYWVANVAHFKTSLGTSYEKIRTSLPLFYIHDSNLPMPNVSLSHGKLRTTVRSDKLIEKEPFLSMISAYRYIK